MKSHSLAPEDLATESIQLPSDLASRLKAEAERNRLSIPELLMQWVQDQADGREAVATMKRIKSGKEKVSPAADVWARLGI